MSQSAIWDALQVVGDCLQDGRLDDADRALAEIDTWGAWDFEHHPKVSFGAVNLSALTEYFIARYNLVRYIPATTPCSRLCRTAPLGSNEKATVGAG